MSLLSPLFLLAGVLLAVPIALHLMHRDRRRQVLFPALRYLQRTERDHARRIRMRQWLLLALRTLALALLVLAGARLLWSGAGAAHPPTSIIVVIDNSVATQRVIDDRRLLDALKAQAAAALTHATAEDRIWVLRTGELSDRLAPLDRSGALERIASTQPTDGDYAMDAVLVRAGALIDDAGLDAAELHLLVDLGVRFAQAPAGSADAVQSASDTRPLEVETPTAVLLAAPLVAGQALHHISAVEVGGGLAPLRDQRTSIRATLDGDTPQPVTVRLYLNGTVVAAEAATTGAAVDFTAGPFSSPWISGWVEADPDALRADNRRWFAVRISDAPRVALPAEADHAFLATALATLAEAGRAELAEGSAATAGSADVVFSEGAAALGATAPTTAVVVLPPSDPSLLPALNRRLEDAGVPWHYSPPQASPSVRRIAPSAVPAPIADIIVERSYGLAPVSNDPAIALKADFEGGDPWLVATETRSRQRVLLLAHPLEPSWTRMAVDAAMLPFVEWIVGGWGAARSTRELTAGRLVGLPTIADSVELPDGTRQPTDGTSQLSSTQRAGIYTVFAADSIVEQFAVQPAAVVATADLVAAADLEARFPGAVALRWIEPQGWAEAAFVQRHGQELWALMAALALLLLFAESLLAASGAAERGSPRTSSSPPLQDRRAENS